MTASSIADLTRREADLALRFVRPRGADLVARLVAWTDGDGPRSDP